MEAKLKAIPLPDFTGKKVLDVGTDFGFWAFHAESLGASEVLALDRNRVIRGQGKVDLIAMNRAKAEAQGSICEFQEVNVGKQWHMLGSFDVIFVMSVYHHIYENCGSHASIWFWLRWLCREGGSIYFEGPTDDSDPVVRKNVSDDNRVHFTLEEIQAAAGEWFHWEYVGPALHEPTRAVWRYFPKNPPTRVSAGNIQSGAGGASKAFKYADGARAMEIADVLGFSPFPGSLNVMLDKEFDWNRGYFRAQIKDVVERKKGLDSEWAPRWARFYPLLTDKGFACWAFRFEGEDYDRRFIELLAPHRLRDEHTGPRISLCA